MKLSNLLVLFDNSPAGINALTHAMQLAKVFNSQLSIISVVPKSDFVLSRYFQEKMNELKSQIDKSMDKVIRETIGLSNPTEIPHYSIQIIWGDPFQESIKFILQTNPDLVIMGNHGHHGIKRLLLGSLAEKMVRYSPVPVLICKQLIKLPYQNVLLPIDFDQLSEDSLLMAKHIKETMNPKMTALNVIPPIQIVYFDPSQNVTGLSIELEQEVYQAHQEKMQTLRQQHASMLNDGNVMQGDIIYTVQEKIKQEKIDLVIVATHGNKGLNYFLLGSIADQIIRHASCNILSIAPSNEKAEKIAQLKKHYQLQ